MMKTFSWPACVQNNGRQQGRTCRGSMLKTYMQGRLGPKMDKIVFLAIWLSKLAFWGKLNDFLFAKKERNLWKTNIENFYKLTDFYGWNPALGYLLCKQRVTLPGQQRLLTVPILILWTIPSPILSVWQTTPFNGIKKTRGIWIVTTFLYDLAHIFFHGQPVNKSMWRGNKFDVLTRWSCTHFFHGQPVNKSMWRGNKFDDLTRWSCTHFFHGQPVNKSMRRGNKFDGFPYWNTWTPCE